MEFNYLSLLILFLSGCVGGILAGILGIGGGIIYVFVLSIFLQKYHLDNVEIVKYIVSNSIFAVFFAGVSATLRQIKERNYYLKETLLTAIPGVISGCLVAFLILNWDWYSKEKFTILFILMLIFLSIRMLKKQQGTGNNSVKSISGKNYSLVGLLSGTISSLSGLGGGIIVVPVLSGIMKLNILKATSISLGIMPFYALAISIFYAVFQSPPANIPFSIGYIILPLSIPLALGVVIFAPIGVRIAHKLPQKVIRFLFSLLMLIVIFKMLYGLFTN